MTTIEIVEYDNKYRASSIDLLKKTFHGLSNDLNFSWRFENITKYEPIIVCAVASGKVVCFNSWIKWKFTLDNKTMVGYQAGEAATDMNYRRMGIWGRVLAFGENIALNRGSIDFFFGFPNPISCIGLQKAGYLHLGDYHNHIRILNPFFLKMQNSILQHKYVGMDPAFLTQSKLITPIVDSAYIEWRYHKNPKKYEIVPYSEASNRSIFMLRRRMYYNKKHNIQFPEVLLLDCHFTTYNAEFIKNSFKYLDRLYSRKAVWIKTFFNKRTDKGNALKSHFHWSFRHRGISFFIKNISQAINSEFFNHFDNWDLLPHVIDSE